MAYRDNYDKIFSGEEVTTEEYWGTMARVHFRRLIVKWRAGKARMCSSTIDEAYQIVNAHWFEGKDIFLRLDLNYFRGILSEEGVEDISALHAFKDVVDKESEPVVTNADQRSDSPSAFPFTPREATCFEVPEEKHILNKQAFDNDYGEDSFFRRSLVRIGTWLRMRREKEKELQRTLREWPLCPVHGPVNIRWMSTGSRKSVGEFYCPICEAEK